MNRCPFCDAEPDTDPGSKFIFKCRTEASGSTANAIYLRSHICYEAQLAHLQGLLREAVGLLQEGTMLLTWPNTDALKLKDKAKHFLARPEVKAIGGG